MAEIHEVLGQFQLIGDGKFSFGVSSTGIPYGKLKSLNGTTYYYYMSNTGTLQFSSAIPTTDTDSVTITTTTVDTTATVPLGTRRRDGSGNEFIYLKGITGVTATSNWVTFDADHVTALLAANAKGRVAVFMAVVDANTKFGWAQIYGKCAVAATDAIATNAPLYIDATSGRVDDAAVTGDFVFGAISRSTDASTNIATVELNYPFVTDTFAA